MLWFLFFFAHCKKSAYKPSDPSGQCLSPVLESEATRSFLLPNPWILAHRRVTPGIKFAVPINSIHLGGAVFLPECAIAGILRYNQRWPPEKRKKGQFGPFLLQDCRLDTGIIF